MALEAMKLGMNAVGIEKDQSSVEIARTRLRAEQERMGALTAEDVEGVEGPRQLGLDIG